MGRTQQKKSDEFGFAEMLTSGMLFCLIQMNYLLPLLLRIYIDVVQRPPAGNSLCKLYVLRLYCLLGFTLATYQLEELKVCFRHFFSCRCTLSLSSNFLIYYGTSNK